MGAASSAAMDMLVTPDLEFVRQCEAVFSVGKRGSSVSNKGALWEFPVDAAAAAAAADEPIVRAMGSSSVFLDGEEGILPESAEVVSKLADRFKGFEKEACCRDSCCEARCADRRC